MSDTIPGTARSLERQIAADIKSGGAQHPAIVKELAALNRDVQHMQNIWTVAEDDSTRLLKDFGLTTVTVADLRLKPKAMTFRSAVSEMDFTDINLTQKYEDDGKHGNYFDIVDKYTTDYFPGIMTTQSDEDEAVRLTALARTNPAGVQAYMDGQVTQNGGDPTHLIRILGSLEAQAAGIQVDSIDSPTDPNQMTIRAWIDNSTKTSGLRPKQPDGNSRLLGTVSFKKTFECPTLAGCQTHTIVED